jgi:hypothetical protein
VYTNRSIVVRCLRSKPSCWNCSAQYFIPISSHGHHDFQSPARPAVRAHHHQLACQRCRFVVLLGLFTAFSVYMTGPTIGLSIFFLSGGRV